MICSIIALTFVAVIVFVALYGLVQHRLDLRRSRQLRQPGFPVLSKPMYFRVIVNRNGQYDPSASSQEPLTREAAETLARERIAQGLQVFIVTTDPPAGVVDDDPEPDTKEPWRIVPPFEG